MFGRNFLALAVLAVVSPFRGSHSEPLELRLLSEFPTALCLDGSPAGYYHRLNASSSRFVVYLEGGGFCTGSADCLARSGTPLGSSLQYAPFANASHWGSQSPGIIDPDPSVNPDFAAFNLVYVPYCSGDNHVGRRVDPYVVDGSTNLYFRGHSIIQSVFQDLTNRSSLGISELVFGGVSAGALGVVGHLEAVQSWLPNARIAALLNGGYFINGSSVLYPTFAGTPPWNSSLQEDLQRMFLEWQGYVNEACRADHLTFPEVCLFGVFVRPYLTHRVFWAQAMYDTVQIFAINQAPQEFTPRLAEYLVFYGAMFQPAFAPVFDNPSTGVFEVSCLLHVIEWGSSTVRGISFRQAFGDWYFGNSTVVQLADPYVGLPCNPSCGALTCPPAASSTAGAPSGDGLDGAAETPTTLIIVVVAVVGGFAVVVAAAFVIRWARKRRSRSYRYMDDE